MGKIKNTYDTAKKKAQNLTQNFDTSDWASLATAMPLGENINPYRTVKKAWGMATKGDKLKKPKKPPKLPQPVELSLESAAKPDFDTKPARRKRPGRGSTILTSGLGELITRKPTLLGQ